jgi:hypothetical protein
MECEPVASVVVLNVADPPLRVRELRVVVPSMKVIVPVAAVGDTVAVKVTDA